MTSALLALRPPRVEGRLPGLVLAAAVAAVAWAIGDHTLVPAPLVAVVVGLLCCPLAGHRRLQPGIAFCAGPGLKAGVSLLGAQVSLVEVAALGWPVAAASAAVVSVGLIGATVTGLAFGLPVVEAIIAGSSVAICGASAAIATASVLPDSPEARRTTALVVVGVNILSTAAMILYPLLATHLGLTPAQSGALFGFSIHDAAQAVSAGASLSPRAEHVAAITKLMRVACLAPMVMLIAAFAGAPGGAPRRFRNPPAFLWGFAAALLLRNLNLIGPTPLAVLAGVSRALLLAGVAAMAAQVSVRDLVRIDRRLAATLAGSTGLLLWLALSASIALVE